MIRITNEINGKLYKLVPGTENCEGCCFDTNNIDCLLVEDGFNGRCVCNALNGIRKEVCDEN